MRELDAVLEGFLAHGYEALSEDDKARFETFLDLPDPELYAYLVGRHEPADAELARLVARIRSSAAASS